LDVLDLLILALRIALVAVLYAFLVLVMRAAARGLRAPSTAADAVAGLRLVVVDAGGSGLTPGHVIEVAHDAILGRATRVDVVVADSAVSSEHARLSRVGRAWLITDLGSTNGTRVNDRPIDGEHPLVHGDVLGLGSVRLKIVTA
jgi:pSer/pThr/pTyr-binding forkhead associated (FHA) protein